MQIRLLLIRSGGGMAWGARVMGMVVLPDATVHVLERSSKCVLINGRYQDYEVVLMTAPPVHKLFENQVVPFGISGARGIHTPPPKVLSFPRVLQNFKLFSLKETEFQSYVPLAVCIYQQTNRLKYSILRERSSDPSAFD